MGPRADGLAERGALLREAVSAELPALGPSRQGAVGEPRDRRSRVDAGDRPRPAHRALRRAQPDAAVGDLAGAADRRDGALVSPGHRRDRLRQGGGFRGARRNARADRRLDRIHRQALHRGDRGDLAEAGGGGPRDRSSVPVRPGVRRAAAGVFAVHRIRDVSARFEPAQFDDGGHRGRGRHRRHVVRRVPALRLRLRLRDPDRDHHAHHDRRSPGDRGARDLHRERDARSTSSGAAARCAASGTPRTTDGNGRPRRGQRPDLAALHARPAAVAIRRLSRDRRGDRGVDPDHRSHPRIPCGCAGAGRRSLRTDVAGRLRALSRRRPRRADRNDPHRDARHAALDRSRASGRRSGGAQSRARSRRSISSRSWCWFRRAR